MAEPLTSPRELLATRLRQILWIEERLAEDVLPQLADQAQSIDLKLAFKRHLVETRRHVDTVVEVLEDLTASAEAEESGGFRGLVAEHAELVQRSGDDGLMTDLAHAVTALATEHLEMAVYESLISLAEALGEEEVGIRLREVMEQEEFALEQVESAIAKLLAEKVESERL